MHPIMYDQGSPSYNKYIFDTRSGEPMSFLDYVMLLVKLVEKVNWGGWYSISWTAS